MLNFWQRRNKESRDEALYRKAMKLKYNKIQWEYEIHTDDKNRQVRITRIILRDWIKK